MNASNRVVRLLLVLDHSSKVARLPALIKDEERLKYISKEDDIKFFGRYKDYILKSGRNHPFLKNEIRRLPLYDKGILLDSYVCFFPDYISALSTGTMLLKMDRFTGATRFDYKINEKEYKSFLHWIPLPIPKSLYEPSVQTEEYVFAFHHPKNVCTRLEFQLDGEVEKVFVKKDGADEIGELETKPLEAINENIRLYAASTPRISNKFFCKDIEIGNAEISIFYPSQFLQEYLMP